MASPPAWVWRLDRDRVWWIAAGLMFPEVVVPIGPIGARVVEELQLEYFIRGRPSAQFEPFPVADIYGDGSC